MKIKFVNLPLGVKIIGVFLIIYGVVAVIGIGYKFKIIKFIVSGLYSGQIHISGSRSLVEILTHNVLSPISYILVIIVNFGFLRLKNWGRVLVFYILCFELLGLSGLMYSNNFLDIEHIVTFFVIYGIPAILIAWYLTRRRIKGLFIHKDAS